MKTRKVYVIWSVAEDMTMIFGSLKRAKKWLKNFDPEINVIFDRSSKSDLYIYNQEYCSNCGL